MGVFQKFIIETDDELGDCLIMAKCTYHKQLAINKTKVKGGGWWTRKDEVITFSGDSHDFGKATLEDVIKCVKSGNVYTSPYLGHSVSKEYEFYYDFGSELIKINQYE